MLEVKTLRHTEAKEKGNLMQTCNSKAECGSGEHFTGKQQSNCFAMGTTVFYGEVAGVPWCPLQQQTKPQTAKAGPSPISLCEEAKFLILQGSGFVLQASASPLSPKPQSLHFLDAAICLVLDLPGKDGGKLS